MAEKERVEDIFKDVRMGDRLLTAVEILKELTEKILGAINFDPTLPKWEVENGDLPRTYFSDRIKNFPNKPFNKQAIERMCLLYRSQFGIFPMKEPISQENSSRYANQVIDLIERLTSNNLDELRNISGEDELNKQKRGYVLSCLNLLLLSLEDKEEFEPSERLSFDINEILGRYRVNGGTAGLLTEGQIRNYLVEARGACVRCGTTVIKDTNYSIAELYEFLFLDGTDNITRSSTILLCKNCYELLKGGVSEEEKKKLREKKQKLYIDNKYREELDDIKLEEEIEEIIRALVTVKGKDLIPLDYEPKDVEEKIGDDFLLMDDVKGYVVKYFNFIQGLLKNIDSESKHKDVFIADEIKRLYLSVSDRPGSKQDKYNEMVSWLETKTGSRSRKACEIVISYYIQDCEVFEKNENAK